MTATGSPSEAGGTSPEQGSASARREYAIEGRTVKLPVEVRDASCLSAAFLVPAPAVRPLVGAPRVEVAEVLPARAICTIAALEYRDNDLGVYDEVGVAFLVRCGGSRSVSTLGTAIDALRGRLGAYIHHLPVTTRFSCEAGRRIWGFPKFLAEITFREHAGRRAVTLVADGAHVLTLSVRAGRARRSYRSARLAAYSGLGGNPLRTPFESSAEGVSWRPGGASLELGSHPIAAELRGLGLPRRAVMSTCIRQMRMRFEAPEPV